MRGDRWFEKRAIVKSLALIPSLLAPSREPVRVGGRGVGLWGPPSAFLRRRRGAKGVTRFLMATP